MKITHVDIYQADIQLHEPFRIAVMTMHSARNIFIHIHTDEGISGWGESSPYWKLCGETQEIDLAAARDFALICLEKNPQNIEDRVAELEGYLANNTQILAAFDMAFYDIASRVANMPLYAFLGGEKRQLVTDLTVGIDEPKRMAQKAKEIMRRGFPTIKVKLGTSYHDDIARIAMIRETVGNKIPLRIDANQGWDYSTAAKTLKHLEQYDIEYCEQPVAHWNIDALSRLREITTIPIMADESVFNHHDAFDVCKREACDFINIKLSKSGGIRNALAINSVAESAGKACMVGSMMESRLGMSAAAHFASSRNNIRYFDLDTPLLLKEDPVLGGVEYDESRITLTDNPGLGVEVDPGYLNTWEKVTVK